MIDYSVNGNNVHLVNSYLITDDTEKLAIIYFLLGKVDGLAEHRTAKSMLNEWKAHNIFYQHGWWQDHTADVDFEFKQKWFYKLAWWLVAHIMREKL